MPGLRLPNMLGLPPVVIAMAVLWAAAQTSRWAVTTYIGASTFMSDFHLTAGSAGLLVSVYFIAYAATQLPSGVLTDRVSPQAILRFSSLALIAVTVGFALAPNLAVALVMRGLAGMVDALIWQPAIKRSAQAAPQAYSRAIGLLVAAQGVSLVAMLVVAPTVMAHVSWRTVAYFMLVPVSLGALAVWLPLGPKAPMAPAGPTMRGPLLEGLKTAMSLRRFWVTALPAAMWNGAQFGVMAWLPRFARDVLSLPAAGTGALAAVMALGMIVGGLTSGLVSQRWRVAFFYGGMMLTIALQATFALGGQSVEAAFYPLIFLVGLLFALYFFSLPMVARLMLPAHLGAATGLLNALNFLPAFTHPWAMGLILDTVDYPINPDHTYSAAAYRIALLFPPLILAGAMVLSILLRWRSPASVTRSNAVQ